MGFLKRAVLSLCLFFLAIPGMLLAQAVNSDADGSAKNTAQVAATWNKYGKLPLVFEPNEGQADASVRYLSRSSGQLLLLKENEAVLQLHAGRNGDSSSLRIEFAGANRAARLEGMGKEEGRSNYFIGNDPANWRTNVGNFQAVSYQELYSGVNLLFYGNQGHLEYDFVVSPGEDYRKIRLRLVGGTPRLEKDGSLTIAVGPEAVHIFAPKIYQVKDGSQVEIAGGFQLRKSLLSFWVNTYDHNLPLIIDPILTYSTYVAGSQGEQAADIAIDAAGNAYITGFTFSSDFPTSKPLQPTCKACPNNATVFVTKMNPAGTALVYSTFLGGSGYDQGRSITVDAMGDAIVGGFAGSSDFPTKNPIQPLGGSQGFLASISPDGSSLNFSTYIGGTKGGTSISTVTTDSSGNVYGAGTTDASDFPTTPSSNVIGVPPTYPLSDMFVVKLTPVGTLTFATTIGPDPTQQQFNTIFYPANGRGIATDGDGSVYLGGAASQGLPVTSGAFQTTYTGPQPYCGTCTMGFVLKLKPDGSAFTYATYLGGTGGDQVAGLALDAARNVYVTGNTTSQDFPTTAGSFLPTMPIGQSGQVFGQMFVTKLNPAGTSLVYSTYLGGALDFAFGLSNLALGIAVDGNGEAFTTGVTTSTAFPLKNALQTTLPPGNFGFPGPATYVTELNAAGSGLLFSTFFSGSTSTQVAGIALDSRASAQAAYITGVTFDVDFPTTPGAFQTSIVSPPPYSEPSHAFVTKFDLATPSPTVCADQASLYLFASVNASPTTAPVILTNCGNAPLTIISIETTSIFSESNNCTVAIQPGQSCTVNVSFLPTQRGTFAGRLTISSNAPIQPLLIPIQAQAVAPVVQLSTMVLQLDDLLVGTHGVAGTVIVFNVGDDLLQFKSVRLTSDKGDFTVDASECSSAPVQPSSGCVVLVTFHPKAPGLRTATLVFTDNALDSPQSVAIQGMGISHYPVPSVTSVSPNTLLQNGTGQSLGINGAGFFPASVVRIHGIPIPTTYQSEFYLTAAVPVEFLKSLGQLTVDVWTPHPGGGLSSSIAVMIYQDFAIGANDLIFEPFTRRLYASISQNATKNPNTIVSLDPEKQTFGDYRAVGNGPNRLALSDDGKYLYVGLDSDHTVQQFDTNAERLGSLVPLPNDSIYGNNLTAFDIKVVPGKPQNYVVSLSQYGYPAGLSAVSNGQQTSYLLSNTGANSGVNDICFLANPLTTTFYGYNGYQLVQFGLQSGALSVLNIVPGPPGMSALFACDSKYLYGFSGLVYDPVANVSVGSYPLGPGSFGNSVLPDSSAERTFFLTYGQAAFDIFDQSTFQLIDSLPLPQNATEPYRLARWGRDGFAFLNGGAYSGTGNDLILMRSTLAEPSSGPNPKPHVKSVSPHVRENNGNFQLTVVGDDFVPGAIVRWNHADRTTIFQSSNVLIADIPNSDVIQQGDATITVFNPPTGGGVSNEIQYEIRRKALVSITITPGAPALLKGATLQLTAIGTYTDGSTKDLTNRLTWTSAAKTVASVNGEGLVTSKTTGTTSITAFDGKISASVIVTVYIGDFALTSTSGYQAVVTGQTASYTINVTSSGGFSADVALSVSGLPPGTTASFSPAVVQDGSGNSTFTISASTAATLGLFNLIITGATGTLSHTATVGLGVNSSQGSFTISSSPNPISFYPGSDGYGSTITVTPAGGFTGNVTFSVSGLPPGITAGASPTVVTGGAGTTVLILYTDSNLPTGAYSFTLTGTSGALVSSTVVTVNINPLP